MRAGHGARAWPRGGDPPGPSRGPGPRRRPAGATRPPLSPDQLAPVPAAVVADPAHALLLGEDAAGAVGVADLHLRSRLYHGGLVGRVDRSVVDEARRRRPPLPRGRRGCGPGARRRARGADERRPPPRRAVLLRALRLHRHRAPPRALPRGPGRRRFGGSAGPTRQGPPSSAGALGVADVRGGGEFRGAAGAGCPSRAASSANIVASGAVRPRRRAGIAHRPRLRSRG